MEGRGPGPPGGEGPDLWSFLAQLRAAQAEFRQAQARISYVEAWVCRLAVGQYSPAPETSACAGGGTTPPQTTQASAPHLGRIAPPEGNAGTARPPTSAAMPDSAAPPGSAGRLPGGRPNWATHNPSSTSGESRGRASSSTARIGSYRPTLSAYLPSMPRNPDAPTNRRTKRAYATSRPKKATGQNGPAKPRKRQARTSLAESDLGGSPPAPHVATASSLLSAMCRNGVHDAGARPAEPPSTATPQPTTSLDSIGPEDEQLGAAASNGGPASQHAAAVSTRWRQVAPSGPYLSRGSSVSSHMHSREQRVDGNESSTSNGSRKRPRMDEASVPERHTSVPPTGGLRALPMHTYTPDEFIATETYPAGRDSMRASSRGGRQGSRRKGVGSRPKAHQLRVAPPPSHAAAAQRRGSAQHDVRHSMPSWGAGDMGTGGGSWSDWTSVPAPAVSAGDSVSAAMVPPSVTVVLGGRVDAVASDGGRPQLQRHEEARRQAPRAYHVQQQQLQQQQQQQQQQRDHAERHRHHERQQQRRQRQRQQQQQLDQMQRDQMQRDQMQRDQMQRDQMQRDQMQRDQMQRDQMQQQHARQRPETQTPSTMLDGAILDDVFLAPSDSAIAQARGRRDSEPQALGDEDRGPTAQGGGEEALSGTVESPSQRDMGLSHVLGDGTLLDDIGLLQTPLPPPPDGYCPV